MFCQNCGKDNINGSKFCISCGKELFFPVTQFCPKCGAKITASGVKFCEKCGTSLVLSTRENRDLEQLQNATTAMPTQNNYMGGFPPINNNAPVENQINVLPSATDMVVGSVLADAVYDEDLKSANIAAILCLCLGWYGAHDFYCSKIHNAVIKLILGLTGIGLIATVPWALMDLWRVWKGEYVDGNGRKLNGKATILVVLFVLIIAAVAFCVFFQLFYQQEMMQRSN